MHVRALAARTVPFIVAVVLCSLFPAAGAAQQTSRTATDSASGASVPAPKPASVTILNRTVVVFRSSLYGYTPDERAAIVNERIEQQIQKGAFGPVTTREDRVGTLILNNGQIAFTIIKGDLDPLADQTMAEAGSDAVRLLTLVLEESQELNSKPILLKALVRTVLASVLFILSCWAIRRLYRWTLGRLKMALRPRLEKLAIGGSVYLTGMVMAVLRFFLGLTAWAAVLFAANLWLTYWLHLFPYTRPWGETLREQVLIGLQKFIRAIIGSLPNLLVVLFIFIVARTITLVVRQLFAAIEKGQLKVAEPYVETAHPTSRIIVAVVWIVAVVAAYPYIPGSNTDAFKGVSLFVGLLISLGSTSVVGQAASGLLLMYSRALKPGDYVRVGETEGTVVILGMLSTKIRTPKNEEISIPNGVMIGTSIKNYTRLVKEEGVIVYTSVTIGYDTPWRQVHAMLIQAADRTEGLRKDAKPFVFQTALSDFYVEYQLNAYIKKPEGRVAVLAALHANIQDAFNEFGVQIMSPHYLGDPEKAKVVPKATWYQPPAKAPEDERPR
jgi:small-conductance mechanosensitive channel